MMQHPGLLFVACLTALIGFRYVWGPASKVYLWAFIALANGMAFSLALIWNNKIGCLL